MRRDLRGRSRVLFIYSQFFLLQTAGDEGLSQGTVFPELKRSPDAVHMRVVWGMKEFAEYLQFIDAVNDFMVTAKRLLDSVDSSSKHILNKG